MGEKKWVKTFTVFMTVFLFAVPRDHGLDALICLGACGHPRNTGACQCAFAPTTPSSVGFHGSGFTRQQFHWIKGEERSL